MESLNEKLWSMSNESYVSCNCDDSGCIDCGGCVDCDYCVDCDGCDYACVDDF